MNCFTLEDWVDFAREVVPSGQRAAMQRHLERGCKRCAKSLRLWRSVLALAGHQPSSVPPERVVRLVKASYHQFLPRREPGGVATVASLLFDSFRQPRPAGIRASRQPLPQQLLYAAGDYLIDLRVEGGSRRVTLLGQILNSSRPKDSIKDVPVALVSGNAAIAKAFTSLFGEFQFEFEPEAGRDLQLALGFARGPVTVSLRDLKPPLRRLGTWQRSLLPYIFGGRNPFRAH